MSGIRHLPFTDVFDDASGGNVKTLQSDYLPSGRVAVVDQGKELIAGFTDNEDAVCDAAPPVIVFGDHTCIFKYIDFPFAMGADGVKVLKPKIEADTKYLFYCLRRIHLPDTGYDRHFKYLKRSTIPLPPLAEQKRIAAVLDKADDLRGKRRQALATLDTLLQSVFLDMFGDPVTNPKGWPEKRLAELISQPLRNGISPASDGTHAGRVLTLSAVTGQRFDALAVKESMFAGPLTPDDEVDHRDLLICRGNGNLNLVGRGFFPPVSLPGTRFPDTMIAARLPSSSCEAEYVEHFWNDRAARRQIETLARTTNGTHKVNQTAVESIRILMPPVELQRTFGKIAKSIKQERQTTERGDRELDALFAALQSAAFAGTLFNGEMVKAAASKPAHPTPRPAAV